MCLDNAQILPESVVANAERQRRWLRRGCWTGGLIVLAALLFVIGNPLFVRWQLMQHGWIFSRLFEHGRLPNWCPEGARPWVEDIHQATINRSPVSVSDIEKLSHFSNLTHARFHQAKITDQAFDAMAKLDQLCGIEIWASQFDEASLRCLVVMPNLLQLEFCDLSLGEAAFEQIGDCRTLKTLQLVRTPFGDESLIHLEKLPHLRILVLSETGISDRGIEMLARCPSLDSLALREARLTDKALQHIASLPTLRSLYIVKASITDEGICTLKKCSTLEHLRIDDTSVTQDGIDELRRTNPKLDVHFGK